MHSSGGPLRRQSQPQLHENALDDQLFSQHVPCTETRVYEAYVPSAPVLPSPRLGPGFPRNSRKRRLGRQIAAIAFLYIMSPWSLGFSAGSTATPMETPTQSTGKTDGASQQAGARGAHLPARRDPLHVNEAQSPSTQIPFRNLFPTSGFPKVSLWTIKRPPHCVSTLGHDRSPSNMSSCALYLPASTFNGGAKCPCSPSRSLHS